MRNRNDQQLQSAGAAASRGSWQASNYYPSYNANTPLSATTRSPNSTYDPYASRSPGSMDGSFATTVAQQPSEEELVNQQMAKLLTRPDLGLNQSSSRSTFHLDWPQGEDADVEPDNAARRHERQGSGSQYLVPNAAGRDRSSRGGTSPGGRHKRAGSRDDRRREIEMNNLYSAR